MQFYKKKYSFIHHLRYIILQLCIFIICTTSPSTSFSQQTDTDKFYQKGFKSLFVNDGYDSTKPYIIQINPRAFSFIQEYVKKQGKELEKMKAWGKSYFNLYDGILKRYDIPVEMKYLSVIESHLQSNLVSWAGAVGPWQLMDYEAKRFGLSVGKNDERMDYTKSTQVACKLMKELYAEFGDWLLVVAAYNGGAGRVRSAIKKSGSREFWDLQYFLLEETRNHVKKFIATHYLFENGGGVTTASASEVKKATVNQKYSFAVDSTTLANTVKITVEGRYNTAILCDYLGMKKIEFDMLNSQFERDLAAGKKYYMRIPKEKEQLFYETRNVVLEKSIRLLLNGK